MVQVLNALTAVVVGFMLFVVLRWWSLGWEQRRILSKQPLFDDDRFDSVDSDEADQVFSGRVIRRLRSRVVEGRIEIHWQFHPEYVHRGFLLTGKSRRNEGSWEPLACEAYQDSGSWIECFSYGEGRSYLFTVKKQYHFFFGFVSGDEIEVTYDQISFSVRKGKYLKEKAQLMRDRTQVLAEVKQYAALEAEIRTMMAGGRQPNLQRQTDDGAVAHVESQFRKRSSLADFVETKRNEIRAHPSWSEERKQAEIEVLEQLAEEAALNNDN